MKRIKQINSYAGMARFLAECDWDDDDNCIIAGWLARVQVEDIPSPYAYSPSKAINVWKGRKIVTFETRHRHYEIHEVPANMLTFKTDDAATDWNTRFSRKSA